jgi:hypothetical protein
MKLCILSCLVVGLLLLSGACIHDPSSLNQPPHDDFVTIDVTAEAVGAWTHRHSIEADLDGDGAPETVILLSDVETLPDGRPIWEDGHRWALLVMDGSVTTLAYAAFVPNGFVEAAIGSRGSDGRREVVLLERTPAQLRTLTVVYDGPGKIRAASAAHYQIESWLPGFARLPD